MKTISAILLTAILTGLLMRTVPWWSGSILACVIAYFWRQKPRTAFFGGFLGVALAWGVIAWRIDIQNGSILSKRIGELLMGIHPVGVILITAIIGGLTGGIGALTGSLLGGRKKRAINVAG